MHSENRVSDGRIEWSKNFETGIQRIDFEHEVFLELINSLKYAIENNRDDSELFRIIIEIEKYAEFHFISEENFMLRINYPQYKSHQIAHFDLLEQFNLSKHKSGAFPEFLEFLYIWFVNHTVLEDKKIKEFVQENNIEVERFYYNLNK